MGTFTLAIQVGTPDGSRYEWFEALVDTGATYTTLPASALRALGVVPHDRALFRLADNREVEYEIGETKVRVDGRPVTTIVVFGPADTQPILGAYVLEGLLLGVDPVGRRLIPVPGLLM